METVKKFSVVAALAAVFLACAFNIEWFRVAAARAGRYTPDALKFAALAAAAATYFSFRRKKAAVEKAPPSWLREAGATSAAVIFFYMPLFQAWISDKDPLLYSENHIVGAYMQSNDAGGYYFGAQELVRTGKINDWNLRRPLNVAWQSLMHTLAGWDLRWFLIMQATLLGLACYSLAGIIGLEFGTAAGTAAFMLMLMWGRCFVYTTLNESLGMTLGASSLALIWTGIRTRNLWLHFSGLTVMTMAINARAGAFFTLPLLALWGGWAFSERGRFSIKPAGAGAAAVLMGFLIHMAPPLIYNGELSVGHYNFACVVYGISAGGVGWKEAYIKYSSSTMDDAEFSKFIYKKSLEKIKSDPGLAARGLMKYMNKEFQLVAGALITLFFEKPLGHIMTEPSLIFLFFTVAGILGAGWFRFMLFNIGDNRARLILVGTGGLLISLPALAEGEWRAITSTIPLIAVHAGFAFAGLQKNEAVLLGNRFPLNEFRPARYAALPAIISIVILFSCIAGPGIAHQMEKTKYQNVHDFNRGVCRYGEKKIVIDAEKALFLEILADNTAESTFKPKVRKEDLIYTTKGLTDRPGLLDDEEVVANYSGPKTIIYAVSRDMKEYHYIFAPPGAMKNPPAWMYFCGNFRGGDASASSTGIRSIFAASGYGPAGNRTPKKSWKP